MRVVALIGDMVASRNQADRRKGQEMLQAACESLNNRAAEFGLLSPLTLTLGDEFQALFNHAEQVWRCVVALEAAMAPVAIRFALGVGEITTEINTQQALGMDGPAFYHARDGIVALKKTGHRYTVQGLDSDGSAPLWLQPTLDLVSHQRQKWQANRVHILAGMMAGKPVAEMAESLGISEQAVYANIRDGALDSIVEIFAASSASMQAGLDEGLEEGADKIAEGACR